MAGVRRGSAGASRSSRPDTPSAPEIAVSAWDVDDEAGDEPDGEVEPPAAGVPGDSSYVADVLDIVDRIPPGRVLTYGDIAALVGTGGPRQVGQVMSRWGSDVPWWRVLRADGRPAQGHEDRALRHYADEDTPLRPDGRRVDLRRARWDAQR